MKKNLNKKEKELTPSKLTPEEDYQAFLSHEADNKNDERKLQVDKLIDELRKKF